ncbi:hypothetical protein RvVAR031_36470 [Agrobacterium vitis]|uniref:hypothetical protein n=1 Tax=Agrobacterium vitis TaxID=373 RepID=UPI0015DACDD2|nr:hypothetical protein [Agrobacterium vitis]BCH56037.1 hypothetical protein RvVAR031_36470 [Agrobacterium vitis]
MSDLRSKIVCAQPQAVAVNPLEWSKADKPENTWFCIAVTGEYVVRFDAKEKYYRLSIPWLSGWQREASPEEAFVTAQTMHDTRIRSAITTAPAQEPTVDDSSRSEGEYSNVYDAVQEQTLVFRNIQAREQEIKPNMYDSPIHFLRIDPPDQQARIDELEKENAQLSDENYELKTSPWPEWAAAVLKVVRKHSGYDGYGDATEGVDLPTELAEHLSAIEQDADKWMEKAKAAQTRIAELEAVISKINDIRNCIIGTQSLNWSEHVYPLVAALNKSGFMGMEYPEARKYFGTMLERTVTAEDRSAELEAALKRTTNILEEWTRYHSGEMTCDIEAAMYEARTIINKGKAGQ